MPPVLKLGTLDLSDYIGLQKEDGFDPFDPDYKEPQFGTSPLREGGVHLGDTVGLREMVWPLKLKATSKDALHALEQQIVREGDREDQRVEWRDAGATASTFFDIAATRWEPEFHYWRGQKNRVNGVLRVWVQPYGHTATARLIASAALGNSVAQLNHLQRVNVPSGAIAGDIPALLDVRVKPGTVPTREVAVSVLPHASYQPQVSATQLTNLLAGATTRLNQTGPALGSYVEIPLVNNGNQQIIARANLPIPSTYLGRNRVLAFIRNGFTRNLHVHARDYARERIGPTVVLAGSQSDFDVVDLGVLSVEAMGPSSQYVEILAGMSASVGYAATRPLDLQDVVVLPEDQTALAQSTELLAGYYFHFDGSRGQSWQGDTSDSFYRTLTGRQRGRIPGLPGGQPGAVTALALDTVAPGKGNHLMSTSVKVRERFSFAR